MTSDDLLVANDVAMHFGGVKALDSISFRLRRGELRCLIGPNGAGKTTFFRCLTGTLRPTRGDIVFRGMPLTGKQRFQIARQGISIKTQIPSLFDGLTAQENLWLSLRTIKSESQRKARIDDVMQQVNITHLRDRVMSHLAHGERQLVELAMVVACEPELILLDEPAAGMTGEETDRLAGIVTGLTVSHTVMVVEHDIRFIEMIADQVTVFHQGRIFDEGHVSKVLSSPAVRDIYLGKKHA